MSDEPTEEKESEKAIIVARCHEIQLALRDKEVAKFESIPEIGMAVQLAIHIRGLPLINYEHLKLVASALLHIPRLAIDRIVELLAEVEFVRLQKTGKWIEAVLPTVPFFNDLYEGLGEYFATVSKPNEFEEITLALVNKLAESPYNTDYLRSTLSLDAKSLNDAVAVGTSGSYIVSRRSRGRDVLINPTYFSENAEIFADHVAAKGAKSVKRTIDLVRQAQGWPLSLLEKRGEIKGTKLEPDDILLLKRLAQDGAIRPPTITTSYSGENAFVFTPTPTFANVSPTRREIYEKSMAIVAAIRQGQLLPNRYRIRSPGAVLYTLKRDLKLSPTTDYAEQYRNLVHLRIARLNKLPTGFRQLEVIDTPENREALRIAYDLVSSGSTSDLSVDHEASKALQGDQEYVESLIGSKLLREKGKISLPEDKNAEIEQLLLEVF